MFYKDNKNFYNIFIFSFTIFCLGFICIDIESKYFLFISSLSGGIVSACILYYFVEIKPTNKKRKDTLEVLNKTVSSLLESFFSKSALEGLWKHEKSIKDVPIDSLNSIDKISKAINDIKSFNIQFFQLSYTIQTAHSRYNDFQHLLILANDISPEHSLLWLNLTEKVRLMKEEYDIRIENADQKLLLDLKLLKNYDDESNETYLMYTSYQIRVLEFFESVEYWIKENRRV